MRWIPGGRSRNLEDRRGAGGFSGMGMGMPMGIGGTLVVLVLSLIFGGDIFSGMGGGGPQVAGPLSPEDSAREETQVQFVSFVLDDAQTVWGNILSKEGTQYQDAKLVLFRNATQSGCGVGQSAMGPFYCPLDQRVYIDLGFLDELDKRFEALGDFAQAYVLAHEIGHHVQHLLGTDAQVRRAQQGNPDMANNLSVRLELQADCYAGVWGHSTDQRKLLHQGDIEEGLSAAAAVGDDRIQKQSTGSVNVDAFTHGSSAQRMEWFKRGLSTGSPGSCNTFGDLGM